MHNDSDNILSDILSRWHHWQAGYRHNRGFPSKTAGCEDWRASRQYDGDNGALDAALEQKTMETVDFEVNQMKDPWRSGLNVNARALSVGVSVFRHPRLPEDRVACLHIIAEARSELTRRLLARGVM